MSRRSPQTRRPNEAPSVFAEKVKLAAALAGCQVIVTASVPPPPPQAPIEYTQPTRVSKAKVAAAVIIVVLLIGSLGAYFLVLAPRMSIVSYTHAVGPLPESLAEWQYSFQVTVKNTGILSGKTTIVCEFSYVNNTDVTRTFTGSNVVSLDGGEQGEYIVKVLLPLNDAAASILTQNKSWTVHLA